VISLVVRPLAEADIDEAFAWYEQRSVSLGVEFLRAVDMCFDAIVATPLAYPVVYARGAFSAVSLRSLLSLPMTGWRFSRARTPADTHDSGDGVLDA
jgi:plasmid stabilization system protein ParE